MASDFDDLMKQMGVKPMQKSGSVRRKKALPTPKKKVVQQPKVDRTEALERTLAVTKEERTAAESKVTTLKKRVRRLKEERAALESQLAESKKSIAEILTDWGFATAEERAALLALDGWLERIISHPSLADDVGLRTEIGENTVRVCQSCAPPGGKQPLHVHAERCVVCGGVNLDDASRTFVDSALLHGRLRIVIVGRTTSEHRLVRKLIGGDKRLVLTQLPGDVRRAIDAARTDVDHADVVVVWDENSLPDALLDVYSAARRYGSVRAGPVGVFLNEAAKIIAAD